MKDLFDRCCQVRMLGIRKLTIGLFWINPQRFLPCDKKTMAFGKSHDVDSMPVNFRSYVEWLREISTALDSNFPKVSHEAHLWALAQRPAGDVTEGAGIEQAGANRRKYPSKTSISSSATPGTSWRKGSLSTSIQLESRDWSTSSREF